MLVKVTDRYPLISGRPRGRSGLPCSRSLRVSVSLLSIEYFGLVVLAIPVALGCALLLVKFPQVT